MRGAVGALVDTWLPAADPACLQEEPGAHLEGEMPLLPRLQESEGDFAADLRGAGTPTLLRVGEALARLLPLEMHPLKESDSLIEGQISRRHLEGLRAHLQDIRSVLVCEGALAGDALAQDVADHYALALATSDIIGAAARAAKLRAAEKGTLASERRARAWARRRDQAGIRLREARRHLRHVRKAGLLGKGALAAQEVEKCLVGALAKPPGELGSPRETSSEERGVPCEAANTRPSEHSLLRGSFLTIPLLESPRSVVIGAERERARRTRQQWQDGLSAARALQEAWPPPERIAARELWRPECPYNPFCYVPGGDGEDDMGGDNLESLGASTRPWVLACEHPAPSDILDEYEVPEAMRVGFELPSSGTGGHAGGV
jgi:hypothetical protein